MGKQWLALRSCRGLDTENCNIELWKVAPGEQATLSEHPVLLLGHQRGVSSVAFAPGGKLVVSGDGNGSVRLWHVADGSRLDLLKNLHIGSVQSLALAPCDSGVGCLELASGGSEGAVRFRRVQSSSQGQRFSKEESAEHLTGLGGSVRSLAWAPGGRSLAVGGDKGTISIWEVFATCSGLDGRPLIEDHFKELRSVAYSSTGLLAAGGCGRGASCAPEIVLWDADAGVVGKLERGHEQRVRSVAFSPADPHLLATGGDDRTIRFWHAVSGKMVAEVTVHVGSVLSIAFSPDGKNLASGGREGTVRVWDVAKFQPIGEPLTGHTGRLRAVAFSIDSEMVASAGDHGAVRLWDVASRRPLRDPLLGHVSSVRSLAFHPEGGILASADRSPGTVWLWSLGADDLIERACRLANRNLTRAEWRQYLGQSLGQDSTTARPVASKLDLSGRLAGPPFQV